MKIFAISDMHSYLTPTVKALKDAGWDENNPKRWFDWYHWHIEYWGTKWNSYDATYPEPEEIEADGLDEIKIWLYTAWTPATPDVTIQ